ncbi:MAG: exosortase-associated EpsI family protein [Candidatus Omnitrophica bacterium]|nr:exosortase-associated EpsI family protein [Candidatus Omnitrophota bacterium]
MQKTRLAVVITLVAATLAISFLAPKVKYKSTDFLSRINVPFWLEDWQSRDISYQLDLDDPTYGFAGNVFARLYNNRYGENLAFLILDAGNFHNPKVCFGASGYTMKELPDLELTVAGNRRLEAKTIYAGKGGEGYLLVYWICINKEVVDWTKQKAIQLW